MNRGAGPQQPKPTDVRTNTLVRVPGLSLGIGEERANRDASTILITRCHIIYKRHGGGESVGMNRAVQCG